MHQTNDGMTDREAVGNETQYVNNTTTMYFMYDYDLFYKQTNLATFIGNWRTRDNSSFNITADYRNNPFLTTTNALIGQPVSTLDQLRQTFTLPEIQQLAQDRTGLFRSLALSATKTLSPRYQLNGDITVSSLGGTPASGGVAATPPTGDLYYYNLQLVANNLLTSNDVAILGTRYYTDVSNDTVGVNFSDRFSINPRWRMNPLIGVAGMTVPNGSPIPRGLSCSGGRRAPGRWKWKSVFKPRHIRRHRQARRRRLTHRITSTVTSGIPTISRQGH